MRAGAAFSPYALDGKQEDSAIPKGYNAAAELAVEADRLILEDSLNPARPGKSPDASSRGFDGQGSQRIGTSGQPPSTVLF